MSDECNTEDADTTETYCTRNAGRCHVMCVVHNVELNFVAHLNRNATTIRMWSGVWSLDCVGSGMGVVARAYAAQVCG